MLPRPDVVWGVLVGGFGLIFTTLDLWCSRGEANGDTFSERLGYRLDTPAKRTAALLGWIAFAAWIPRHIGKPRPWMADHPKGR